MRNTAVLCPVVAAGTMQSSVDGGSFQTLDKTFDDGTNTDRGIVQGISVQYCERESGKSGIGYSGIGSRPGNIGIEMGIKAGSKTRNRQ